MSKPDLSLEARFGSVVAGVDEAGRGPWAGPVVAAAVVLNTSNVPAGIDDSKRLTKGRREVLFEIIVSTAAHGIGKASVDEIDQLNIRQATHLAMCRAVAALPVRPNMVLVDGHEVPAALHLPAEAFVKGDSRSLSIAAASILAKVTRDRIMTELDEVWPGYGWSRNAGYGVPAHIDALRRLGVTPHHRRSFRPIHNMLCEE